MVSKQLIKGCHDCFLSSSFSFDSFFILDMILSVYIHRSHTLVHAVWTIGSPPPFRGEEELASQLAYFQGPTPIAIISCARAHAL